MAEKHEGSEEPGYPLADFLRRDGLDRLQERLSRRRAGPRRKTATPPETAAPPREFPGVDLGDGPEMPADPGWLFERFRGLLEGVTLCRLHGSTIRGSRESHYVYEIGLNATRTVGMLLRNPVDTLLTFGPPPEGEAPTFRPVLAPLDLGLSERAISALREAGIGRRSKRRRKGDPDGPAGRSGPDAPTRPCAFNACVVLDSRRVVQMLQVRGTGIRFHLSPRLVRPVVRDAQGAYVPQEGRVAVALGDRTITLCRGLPPQISGPLEFEDNLVQVAGQNVIARLRRLKLGGTSAQPKLIFADTEFIF